MIHWLLPVTPSALLPWLWIFYVNGRHAELLHQLSLKQTLYCFPCPGDQFGNTPIFFSDSSHKSQTMESLNRERRKKGRAGKRYDQGKFWAPRCDVYTALQPQLHSECTFCRLYFLILHRSHKCGGVTLKLSLCFYSHGMAQSFAYCHRLMYKLFITLKFVNFRVSKDCFGLSTYLYPSSQ